MELFIYKYVLGLSTTVFTSSMISGQMWNYIKRPYTTLRDHEGIVTYIYPYSSYQTIYESFIMLMLYTILVFGFLLLNYSFTMKSSSINCNVLAFSSIALVMSLFSIILSIFKSKANEYPYSLLESVMMLYMRIYNLQA